MPEPTTADPTSQQSDNGGNLPDYLTPDMQPDNPQEQPAQTEPTGASETPSEPTPEPAQPQPIQAGGKTWDNPDELARAYTELNSKLGQQGQEIGELRRALANNQAQPQPDAASNDPLDNIDVDEFLTNPKPTLQRVYRAAVEEARRDPDLVAAKLTAQQMRDKAERDEGRRRTGGLVTDAEADAADESYFRQYGTRLAWPAAYELAAWQKSKAAPGDSRVQANDTAARRSQGVAPSGSPSTRSQEQAAPTPEQRVVDELRDSFRDRNRM